MRYGGVPDIPPPQHLRPCCDFGYKLKPRYAFLPILGYTLTNLKTVDEIGPHDYDTGVVNSGSHGELVSEENNGLVYTCSGSFIDTAHVRDYADWTTYLGSRLFGRLASGATIQLSNEAGERRVVARRSAWAVARDRHLVRLGVLPRLLREGLGVLSGRPLFECPRHEDRRCHGLRRRGSLRGPP